MTRAEFIRQYNAYPWEPYRPLAMILATGACVYIDKPGQMAPDYEEVTITRWQKPQQPERYRYADITRLAPLDELPTAPDGMSYAEFDALISSLLIADPFQPFVIELKSGGRVELDARGGTTRAGRFIKVWDGIGQPTDVNFDQIARLTRKAAATVGGSN